MGLWTSPFPDPGVNWEYMEFVANQIIECIGQAYQNMEKARLWFASSSVPGLMKNSRDPGRVYPDLELMKVEGRGCKTIATMINYAGHPEVLWSDNLEITSEYVSYLCEKVEEELGGIAIFFNGALGGMITPDVDEHTFEKAKELGYTLADATINALRCRRFYRWGSFFPSWKKTFNLEKQTFEVPLENLRFYGAMLLGMLYRPEPWYVNSPELGTIMSEVNLF